MVHKLSLAWCWGLSDDNEEGLARPATTKLKIMVSPVRIRVAPLSSFF
jgi:hypothetical protein